MGLTEKMIDIQSKLKAPKSQYNSFGGYKYRNCEDILEAIKPLLSQNGLYITLRDEIVEVGGRVYIKATAAVTDGENSVFTTAYAREEETKKGMDSSQITGSCSSYARKYALNGLFAIDDTKDSDTTNAEREIDKKYNCSCCGRPFEAFTSKSKGKTYTAGQVYHMSIKKNGAALCRACAEKKAKGELNDA